MALHAGLDAPMGIKRDVVEARAGAADNLIFEVIDNRNGVRMVSIWKTFCGDIWCEISDAGVPLYYDDDHLSYTGAVQRAAPALIAE